MQLKDIMSHDVKSVTPETVLTKAAEIMKQNDLGSLPVVKDGRLVGFLTDRDMVVRALAEKRDPDATTAGDIMTKGANVLTEDQEVLEAVHLMEERQIRRVPILDRQQRLCGMVSLGDVAVRAHDIAESGEALERICARPVLA